MNYIEEIIKKIKPRSTRPYKNGVELRGINVDQVRTEIQQIIDTNAYPVEIFDVDIILRSISIRQTA